MGGYFSGAFRWLYGRVGGASSQQPGAVVPAFFLASIQSIGFLAEIQGGGFLAQPQGGGFLADSGGN